MEQFKASIKHIISLFSEKFQNEKNMDSLMKWLNDMKDIKNKNKVNIIDIKMFIQSNIGMTEKLESEIQIIESIDISGIYLIHYLIIY